MHCVCFNLVFVMLLFFLSIFKSSFEGALNDLCLIGITVLSTLFSHKNFLTRPSYIIWQVYEFCDSCFHWKYKQVSSSCKPDGEESKPSRSAPAHAHHGCQGEECDVTQGGHQVHSDVREGLLHAQESDQSGLPEGGSGDRPRQVRTSLKTILFRLAYSVP